MPKEKRMGRPPIPATVITIQKAQAVALSMAGLTAEEIAVHYNIGTAAVSRRIKEGMEQLEGLPTDIINGKVEIHKLIKKALRSLESIFDDDRATPKDKLAAFDKVWGATIGAIERDNDRRANIAAAHAGSKAPDTARNETYQEIKEDVESSAGRIWAYKEAETKRIVAHEADQINRVEPIDHTIVDDDDNVNQIDENTDKPKGDSQLDPTPPRVKGTPIPQIFSNQGD